MARESGVAMGQRAQGVLLLLVAGILWGFNGLYVQVLARAGMSPTTIVFARYLCALFLLVPIVSVVSKRSHRDVLAIAPQFVACCVGMGLVSNALGSVLSAYAISQVGVSVNTVLLYTAPVFGCVMSWRLFGESMGPAKLAAIISNFIGVVLVVAAGGDLGGGGSVGLGIAAGLSNGFAYALMAILIRPVAGKCHPLTVVFYGSLTACGVLALPALGSMELTLLARPAVAVATLLYGVLSTVVAYFVYQRGMAKGVETSQVAVITSVVVAVSSCVGTIVLGEPFSLVTLIGIGCVLASIVLMNLNAHASEIHGVHMLLTAEQLRTAYGVEADLDAAVNSVRERRERMARRQ